MSRVVYGMLKRMGMMMNCLGVKCHVGSGRRGVGDGGHTLLRIWSLTRGLNGAVKGLNSRRLAEICCGGLLLLGGV